MRMDASFFGDYHLYFIIYLYLGIAESTFVRQ